MDIFALSYGVVFKTSLYPLDKIFYLNEQTFKRVPFLKEVSTS